MIPILAIMASNGGNIITGGGREGMGRGVGKLGDEILYCYRKFVTAQNFSLIGCREVCELALPIFTMILLRYEKIERYLIYN